MERLKLCSKCKITKPFSAFSKLKGAKDGLQHRCRECAAAIHLIWYNKNKEKKSASAAIYYQEHKEELKRNNTAYYHSPENHEKCKSQRLKYYYDKKIEAFDK